MSKVEFACLLLLSSCLLVMEPVLLPHPCSADEVPSRVEFNRDVRSILSDNCFQCHGPDEANLQAELRLDRKEAAFADRGGYAAIVPGKPDESELYLRISSDDEFMQMPPAETGRNLSPTEKAVIRRWIEQGATWQEHWSFTPPRRPVVPRVESVSRVSNPIDAFVLFRLQDQDLSPSPEADATTLIRRVTLDLTGLPPSPEEVDAFLADDSPDAYERLVDRLLNSPRYGERMASRWLDAARYADTNGYQTDGPRYMWRWRDWVIGAFNQNMRFDRFTIEQLAGDLLPEPTLEQRIATAFNRNHRGNGEGGVIAEEYAVEYVVDRVDTTSTVWLGLTMACARCHDHKYDPITQKEFYRLFAFFNNVPESGRALKFGNSPPTMPAPTSRQQEQLAELDQKLAEAKNEFQECQDELERAQAAWENSRAGKSPDDWSVTRSLETRLPLEGQEVDDGETETALTFVDGAPEYSPGKIGRAALFNGTRFIDAGDRGHFGFYDQFSLAAWVRPTAEDGVILSRGRDSARTFSGYNVCLLHGKVHVNLVVRWLDDAIRVQTKEPLPLNEWHHVLVTYDGSRFASGISVYVDGRPLEIQVNLDELNQSFAKDDPFRIGAGGDFAGAFRGSIDEVRIYKHCLKPDEAAIVATSDPIGRIAGLPAEMRSEHQQLKLREYFLDNAAPDGLRNLHRRITQLERDREALVESFPTVMVMKEMEKPRDTHVLARGQYDKPGEQVSPGVPAVFPALPDDAPQNRLGLARWLVNPKNPLTARVAVNRAWTMHFGTGLVETAEDFGSQGKRPSHPELLDWLATEFMQSGWNIKALHRLIVTSATYRQASRLRPELLRRDPENRLLARGPRFRLPAESIRDQALAISGLLVERLGGPSVRPYQPAGIWEELSGQTYESDHGVSLYRRGLYTYWKRTATHPVMSTFDAPSREWCRVGRPRTNTPLQALLLMNDVTFVEMARGLAECIMQHGGDTPAQRLGYAFRLATARKPTDAELGILTAGFRQHLKNYRQDEADARKLLDVGESRPDSSLDVSELAAYTASANTILNLDEVVMLQ